jgi:hypothetical protein
MAIRIFFQRKLGSDLQLLIQFTTEDSRRLFLDHLGRNGIPNNLFKADALCWTRWSTEQNARKLIEQCRSLPEISIESYLLEGLNITSGWREPVKEAIWPPDREGEEAIYRMMSRPA